MNWPRIEQGFADDFVEAAARFNQFGEPLAQAFVEAVARTLEEIRQSPRLHARLETNRSTREIRRTILRRFNYVIVYEIVGEEPIAIAIVHASRLPDPWPPPSKGS